MKPIFTIYHGIKHQEIAGKLTNDFNRIITVCRIDKQKDLTTLLEAIGRLKREVPNISLSLVGDGPEKENVEKLIDKLNLKKNVHLISWKKNIDQYLKNADIFVLSSHYEGFSIAILEAMNWGLPVVSTNSPYGPKEIIQNNKYGLLVPIGDSKKMASDIKQLLKSKSSYKRYSKMSLKRTKDFPLEKMLDKHLMLIYETLK